MSHVATITLEFRDPEALADAAATLGLALAPETVCFYDGTRVTGTTLRLPGWRYPVVIDGEGRLFYDHYEANGVTWRTSTGSGRGMRRLRRGGSRAPRGSA